MTEPDHGLEVWLRSRKEGREFIGDNSVGCKICNKAIEKIFVEHIEQHLADIQTLRRSNSP